MLSFLFGATGALGAVAVAIFVGRLVLWTRKYLWWPRVPSAGRLAERYGRGSWALVTNWLLPLLLDHSRSTGRRSALVNVGSIVGRFYWPGTQLYGACKAFVDHLSVPLA